MLTKRMQIQAIADVRAGFQIDLDPSKFDQPYQAILGAVRNAQQVGIDTTTAMMTALNGCRDANVIMQHILELQPGNGYLHFKSLAEIAPTLPPIRWMWQDWIPRGLLSLVGSVKGAGKSYWLLDLARRIIANETWPDGTPTNMTGATVIYVDAEMIPQLINERAARWEMDTKRFYLMMADQHTPIDLTRHDCRDTLVEMIYQLKPEFVVLDSLGSLNSKGENAKEDVQELLSFLNQVAFEFQIGLSMVHHLRKRNPLAFADLITQDDFRGSGHIVQMCRTVIGISVIQTSAERNPNGPRRVEMVSTNLTAYPDPIGFEFQPGINGGISLIYGDAPEAYREPSERDRCEELILDQLANGPIKPNDLLEIAQRNGFSRATMFRAHDALERHGKVSDTSGNKDPDNQWTLKIS
jgi:hypothetical protein